MRQITTPEKQALTDRANRAVKTFRSMIPGLTSYARALTGNSKITIVVGNAVQTSGDVIEFRPPLALGDDSRHDRYLCDKRDSETLLQMCDACAVREDVLIKIYHEVAHIVYGTFDKPTDEQIKKAIDHALAVSNSRYAKALRAALDGKSKTNYLGVSGAFGPFMPMLVNALEDARVDERMFEARRGTRVMFHAMTAQEMSTGDVDANGNWVTWRDKPLNSQALIGVFCISSGFDPSAWLADEVVEAMRDPKLVELASGVRFMKNVLETYEVAFPILERLRELGFCHHDDDPPQDGESEDEPDDSNEDGAGDDQTGDASDSSQATSLGEQQGAVDPGQRASQGGDSSERDGDVDAEDGDAESSVPQDGDSHDGGADSGDPQDADAGQGDVDEADAGEDGAAGPDAAEDGGPNGSPTPSSPDPSSVKRVGGALRPDMGQPDDVEDDLNSVMHHGAHAESAPDEDGHKEQKAVEVAIIQGKFFDTASVNINGVKEYTFDGDNTGEYNIWNPNSQWANYGRSVEYGFDPDEPTPETILGPALNEMRRTFADNARGSFERNLKSGRVNTKVLGRRAWNHDDRLFQKSRLPGRRSYAVLIGIDISGSTMGENIVLAKQAAIAQAELCSRAGIDFAVYAHTATSPNGDWRSALDVDIYIIKEFGQAWTPETRKVLSSITACAENLDGHTIEYYRKAIERHSATDKIILYYSDGAMPAANEIEELMILQREIAYCRRNGIVLLGVGINSDAPEEHGLETVLVESTSDVSKVVRHLKTALIKSR